MQVDASAAEIKQAQFPHNLLITGLFVFNLFMAPAVIVLHIGMLGLLIPVFASIALVYYIHRRSKQNASPFVAAHWRLAFLNSRWLLLGYALTGTLVLIAWGVSQTAHEASMKHILWTALTRIGIVPTLIAVMVTAMMEASGISQASKQEVPDKLAGDCTKK
jgi:hypothetical protein